MTEVIIMEKKKYPMTDPEEDIIFDCPAASSGDMTGLIPSGNGGDYSGIYQYTAESKDIPKRNR